MSTVIAWATDEGNEKIGSCYIASDSRISWGANRVWDSGQKVFALENDGLIAYCGNVLFPTQILSQLITLINHGVIYKDFNSNDEKIDLIYKYIDPYMKNYPNVLSGTKIIVFLVKDKIFNLYEISQTNYKKVDILPGEVYSYGSGAKEYRKSLLKIGFKNNLTKQDDNTERKFSRYIFQALVHSLDKDESDPFSGGNIQLVGLYKNGTSKPFGIIYKGRKFLFGLEVFNDLDLSQYEWRNENFEISSYYEMRLKNGAQKQPFLKEFKKS